MSLKQVLLLREVFKGTNEGWLAEREGNVTRKLQYPNTILLLALVVLFPVVHAVDYLVRPITPMCIYISFFLVCLVY